MYTLQRQDHYSATALHKIYFGVSFNPFSYYMDIWSVVDHDEEGEGGGKLTHSPFFSFRNQ